MSFLPQGYEPPVSGNYMKFAPGKNRFRILGSAIVGNVFWKTDGEKRVPVRRRMGELIRPDELGVDKYGKPEQPKHFWSFAVWNYSASAVQILEVTQKGIQQQIRALTEDEEWGDPTKYDINVTKTGDGLDTEYQVNPSPAKPLPAEALAAYHAANIDLEALFNNGDPFAGGGGAKSAPTSGEVWTLDQAIQNAGAVGIDKPTLVNRLREKGLAAWNGARDTAMVKAMIAEAEALDAFDALPAAQEESLA